MMHSREGPFSGNKTCFSGQKPTARGRMVMFIPGYVFAHASGMRDKTTLTSPRLSRDARALWWALKFARILSASFCAPNRLLLDQKRLLDVKNRIFSIKSTFCPNLIPRSSRHIHSNLTDCQIPTFLDVGKIAFSEKSNLLTLRGPENALHNAG